MKRPFIYCILICSLTWGNAQETLYANESHVVTLFFPSPIRQALTGAEHFTFSYNRESGQHFGLLQANKGNNSNLLVLTEDGRVYTYGLTYRKHLPETYRFVPIGESIGKETQTMPKSWAMDSVPVPKPIETSGKTFLIEQWKKGSEYILARKTPILKIKRKGDIVLRLKELFYHKNEVYLELEIQNNSVIDFELDVLEIYTINGKKGKRSSHQKVRLKPLYKHDKPDIIGFRHRHGFVYVLPKFTLGDTEKLLIELHEKKGNRMLRLYHR
ncbi:MAG: DUF4138 domain-containing protein [Bacteroidota bacterium]